MSQNIKTLHLFISFTTGSSIRLDERSEIRQFLINHLNIASESESTGALDVNSYVCSCSVFFSALFMMITNIPTITASTSI